MSLDITTISAIADELSTRLIDAKIDKISQPQRDMIIIAFRSRHEDALKLLISVSLSDMRVHLTRHTFDNPTTPPMFCMLLRKHLSNAKVTAITQPPGERILDISLKTSSALGDVEDKHLIIELFGRIPNVILTSEDNIIIDCLRRISGDMDGKRMILPGLKYQLPLHQPLHNNIEKPKQPIEGSISEILDEKYTVKTIADVMKLRSASLLKVIKTAKKRIQRKLAIQVTELENSANCDYYRQCGDIIMANMHRINKGDTVLIADDFYANGEKSNSKREIKLDPMKTPQKNAAKYYKDYTKARNAGRHLTEQIGKGEAELEYIESVLEQILRAETQQDLDEIRDELSQTKYLKFAATGKNVKKMKRPESKPLTFTASSGMQILAGRNNVQNDKLTFKTASRFDTWLHTQKIHGAHVIIRSGGNKIDDATLKEAADIAAYYSAARNAGKVPVDYTLVKHVKKPSGARPGMVIYTDYKTIQGDGSAR